MSRGDMMKVILIALAVGAAVKFTPSPEYLKAEAAYLLLDSRPLPPAPDEPIRVQAAPVLSLTARQKLSGASYLLQDAAGYVEEAQRTGSVEALTEAGNRIEMAMRQMSAAAKAQ